MFKPTNSYKLDRLQVGIDAPAVASGQLSILERSVLGLSHPTGWGTTVSPHLLSTGAAVAGTSTEYLALQNLYHDGTNYRRSITGKATLYRQYDGEHLWSVAASATAGTIPTLNLAVKIDNVGKLTANYGIASTTIEATSVNATTLTDGIFSSTAGIVSGLVSLNGLLTIEIDQLKNIDTSTISSTQWSYLGAMNQGVATTDNVIFNNITGTLLSAAQGNITSVGTLTALTVSGATTFQIGTNIPTGQTYKINNVNLNSGHIGAEPAFVKNTAFNKNFGAGGSDVCVGNDSRLSDNRNPNNHNLINTTNHPVSGLTAGHYIRATAATTYAFSAIQAADIPVLNQNTTGQAGSVAQALTAGTGLSSAGTYNGATARTFSVSYGTVSGTACQGNDTRLSDSRQCNNSFDNAATAKTNLGLSNVENTALSTWTGSANITTIGALAVDVVLASNKYTYYGAAGTDGSWRVGRVDDNLVFERREAGSWIVKSTVLA